MAASHWLPWDCSSLVSPACCFLHFSCGLLRMMPFTGPAISALAIACSKALATSFRDMLAHHGVSSMSCQWGSGPGMFHRAFATLIPIEFRAATILASMFFISSSDKLVQSDIAWSIAPLHHRRKRWVPQAVCSIPTGDECGSGLACRGVRGIEAAEQNP